MAERNLLAIHKLDAFKAYLEKSGIEYRTTNADWQVLQVRVGNGWQPIYKKLGATVHLSVPAPLVELVRQFLEDAEPVVLEKPRVEPSSEPSSDDAIPWE